MDIRKIFGLALTLCLPLMAQTYYPAGTWRTATPESQGLDSAALARAVDTIRQNNLGVHSLLIIRHGYAVADVAFYPYNSSSPHDIASVTKTLTSTLTGIAVANGIVKLDQPLLPFFPAERPDSVSDDKAKITLGNMLRMESGLDCGIAPGEQELEGMKRSANWIKFALALPMKYAPAQHTAYCSPGYHLLGSALAAAAKMPELEFGRKYLFDPLSMSNVIWTPDPQGRSHGWGDSHFLPADIAKLGYLYLHAGQWNGKQIVPADWVTMSTALPAGPRDGPGGMGYEWNVVKTADGMQFGGTGRGSQILWVWPELDMVVVSMAGGNGGQLAPLIRAAVKSPEALTPNPAAFAQLQTSTTNVAKSPMPQPASPMPETAAKISGVEYTFPVNPSRIDSLRLRFEKSNAVVDLRYYGEPLSFPIGLDGVYRLGGYGPHHLLAGATGKWTSDTEFALDLNFIANINHYTLNLKFNGDALEMTASEASGLIRNAKLNGVREVSAPPAASRR